MRLEDPCNFASGKKLFHAHYACPDLLRMMSIIINKSKTRNIYSYIKPAPDSLEKKNCFFNFLFRYSAHQSDGNGCGKVFNIGRPEIAAFSQAVSKAIHSLGNNNVFSYLFVYNKISAVFDFCTKLIICLN